MKKTIMTLGLLLLVAIGGFIWLLKGAASENAPQTPIKIELPDNYEP